MSVGKTVECSRMWLWVRVQRGACSPSSSMAFEDILAHLWLGNTDRELFRRPRTPARDILRAQIRPATASICRRSLDHELARTRNCALRSASHTTLR